MLAKKHKDMTEESLDDENERIFYFKSLESDVTYSITHQQAFLSNVFKSILENNEKEANTEEKAMSFKTVVETYEMQKNKVVHMINTDEMLFYIKQYLDLWQNNIDNANYIDNSIHVQTGDPSQILYDIDFVFLTNFIRNTIEKNKNNISSIKILIDENKYNSQISYKKLINIRLLSCLLAQADYFDIECLFNKICVFIACIIWNGSHLDILEASNDPYFKELQENAINAWHMQNNEHIEKHIRGITAGDGKENESDEETNKI